MVRFLHDNIEMTYSELLREMNMDEGRFNFHLRLVRELTEETSDGKYALSHLGRLAYNQMITIEKELGVHETFLKPVPLSRDIVVRRALAFIVDVVIFGFLTGFLASSQIWDAAFSMVTHATEIVNLTPWFIHPEHLPPVGEILFTTVTEYSHVLFAIYITFTLLDSYKGQTLGRYLLGIRVVTIANRRLDLVQAGVRNVGKVFLLPLDLLLGLVFFSRRGYIKFFDYYTGSQVEKVRVTEPAEPQPSARKQTIKDTDLGEDSELIEEHDLTLNSSENLSFNFTAVVSKCI